MDWDDNLLAVGTEVGSIELYNLKTDIGEQNDVAAEHPEVVEKLRKLMAQQHVPSKDFPFKPID